MNLTEFATPHGGKATRPAKAHNTLKSYDRLAAAELVRRTGKSRGDQISTVLAPPLAQQAQDRLGRELSDYYQAILREPVPERIMALVEALEARHVS
jgi:hypothetical protein